MELVLVLSTLLFGLLFGSFANVLILRDDRRMSIITGRSECPACKRELSWYELLPVVSFVLQQGKCRGCGCAISIQYPLIEITSGILALISLILAGPTVIAALLYLWLYLLLVIAVIDQRTQYVPIDYVVVAALAALAAAWLAGGLPDLQNALLGLVVGAGSILLIMACWWIATRTEGMGSGDVWILAAIGAMLGFPGVLAALFFAVTCGAVVGTMQVVSQGKNMDSAIAFGPYLVFGALLALLFQSQLLEWYTLYYGGIWL